MRIRLESKIKGHYIIVMERFDKQLFEFLLPKYTRAEVIEFTGSRKGDRVHLRFQWPVQADWISDILEHGVNEHEAYFIDEGSDIPFGISSWYHKHIVRKINERESLIIDDIQFSATNKLLALFLYPILYLAFLPRKRLYRRYFN